MGMEYVMGEEIHELALSRMEQEALGDAQRTRLEETLGVWLGVPDRTKGSASPPVAREDVSSRA